MTPDASVEAAPTTEDAASPAIDEAPRDAGPVACGLCVISSCGDTILSCLQSDGCRGVFQCVATDCLASGGLDPLCLFQCAGDDPTGVRDALSVFQCVTGSCGDVCSTLLGRLGGLGDQGGREDRGDRGGDDGAPDALRELFAPWPALLSRPPTATDVKRGVDAPVRR